LINRFDCEELKIPTDNDKLLLDALLIKANVNSSTTSEKKLVIFCCPNGAPYEYYVYQVRILLLILRTNGFNFITA